LKVIAEGVDEQQRALLARYGCKEIQVTSSLGRRRGRPHALLTRHLQHNGKSSRSDQRKLHVV
jgi:hypothetical protein